MSIAQWKETQDLKETVEQLRQDIRTLYEKIERLERQASQDKPLKVRRVG